MADDPEKAANAFIQANLLMTELLKQECNATGLRSDVTMAWSALGGSLASYALSLWSLDTLPGGTAETTAIVFFATGLSLDVFALVSAIIRSSRSNNWMPLQQAASVADEYNKKLYESLTNESS